MKTALLAWLTPFLLAVAALGQPPSLLRDTDSTSFGSVNPGAQVVPLGSTPGNPDTLWLDIHTPASGSELWRLSGLFGLPVMVTDFAAGPESSKPQLIDCGPPAVFAMSNSAFGRELWRDNGFGVLEPLPETVPGKAGACFSHPVKMGSASYVLRITFDRVELLRVSGGQAVVVTELVAATLPGMAFLSEDSAGTLRIKIERAFPSVDDLWFSDCTANGTRLLSGWHKLELAASGDYHAGDDGGGAGNELWKHGQTGSTFVKDINPGAGDSDPREFTTLGTVTFFVADDGSGRKLWQTDGTGVGTVRLISSADPRHLTAFGGDLYYTAGDATNGREPRKYEVSTTTERLLADLAPGAVGSDPLSYLAVGPTLYFSATTNVGCELHRTDGTTVALVEDVFPGPGSGNPYGLFAFGNRLFFGADDGVHGAGEPFLSDGTAAGTALIADTSPPVPQTESGDPHNFYFAGWDTLFAARQIGFGTELYRMTFNGNGPTASAVRIKNINPGGRDSEPRDFVSLTDGRVLFSAEHISFGRELWITDGTDAGTTLVKDIRAGNQGSEPFGLLWVPGLRAVLFTADDGLSGREPWVSDGTVAGTRRLLDLRPGSAGSEAASCRLRRDGAVFFRADDGVSGSEPWVLDHGATTPRLLVDLQDPGGSFPTSFSLVDDGQGADKVFFAATTSAHGNSLYVSDGTTAGTTRVRSFRQIFDVAGMVGFVDARLYFAADDGSHGTEPWKSDGTAAGTVMIADLAPGPNGSIPQEITAVIDPGATAFSRIFFAAGTPLGQELCSLEAHPISRLSILDLNPGVASSDPRALAAKIDAVPGVMFAADGGDGKGHEPWFSDVAFSTTRRIGDLHAAAGVGSDPSELTPTPDGWVFSAADEVHGREVWVFGRLGGTVLRHGTPCGDAQITLDSSPPRIGRPLTLSGQRVPPGSVGLVLIAAPLSGFVLPYPGCGLGLNPVGALIVPVNVAGSDWSRTLPVPGDPQLTFERAVVRGIFLRPGPFPLEFTNEGSLFLK